MSLKIIKYLKYVTIIAMIVMGSTVNSVFTLLALLLAGIIIVNSHVQEIMEVQLLLVSFAGLMFFRSSISLLNIVIVLSVVRLVFLCGFRLQKKTLYFFMSVLTINLISIIVTNGAAVKDLITFDAEMIMLGLALQSSERVDIVECVRVYAIALIISSIVCAGADYLPGIKNYINTVSYRYSSSGDRITRYAGLMGNPNYFTLSLNIAISILLIKALKAKHAIVDYFLVLLMIVFGIMSLSKGFALGLMVNLSLLLLYYIFMQPSKGIKLILSGLLGTIVVVYTVGQQYISILLDRLSIGNGFSTLDLNSYTTNRVDKFKLYFDYMSEHFGKTLIGNGFGTLINGQASHNAVIEGVFFFGIIGFLLLLFSLSRFISIEHINRTTAVCYIPFFVLLARCMGINLWVSISLPYYLFIIIMSWSHEAFGNEDVE